VHRKKVRLKNTKVGQKCRWPSATFVMRPNIFGNQK